MFNPLVLPAPDGRRLQRQDADDSAALPTRAADERRACWLAPRVNAKDRAGQGRGQAERPTPFTASLELAA